MAEQSNHHLLDEQSTRSLDPAAAAALAGRTPDDLRRVCVSIAAEAAALVRSARHSAGVRVGVSGTKSSAVDPVTEIDRASETLIRDRIAAHSAAAGGRTSFSARRRADASSKGGSPGWLTRWTAR